MMQDITGLVAGNAQRVAVDRLKVAGFLGAGAVAIIGAVYAKHPAPVAILGVGAVACGLAAERVDRRVRLGGQLAESADRIALEAIARAYAAALSPQQLQQAIALPAAEPGPRPMQEWWPDVLGYPTVLIYGQFGSGKTTLAERLVNDRRAAGHQVRVLDPHLAAGAWPGCDTVGSGMNYRAIDEALGDFAEEVESRYQALSKDKNATFNPITYICDEFTHWSDRTKNAADFFAATMADTRKVRMHAVFIGHGRTLQCVGGKAGLAKTRDDSLLEIKLTAKPDPSSPTGVSPTGLGELKYPGNPDPVPIAIERFGALHQTTATPIAPAQHQDDREWLARCWQQPAIEVGHETLIDEAIAPTEHQQELLDLLVEISRKAGSITAADCKRSSRKFKAISADDIRQLFLIAQAVGLGVVDGEGQSARFTALKRG
jgi:hypothetical protein